eukprot:5049391-Alexandrium_andersonii.AAC.1
MLRSPRPPDGHGDTSPARAQSLRSRQRLRPGHVLRFRSARIILGQRRGAAWRREAHGRVWVGSRIDGHE